MECIHKLLKTLFALYLGLFLFGCAPGPFLTFKNEIGKTSELWGGYTYGDIYILKHDMFLRENSQYTSNQLLKKSKILVPPLNIKQGGLYSAPESIESYKNNPINQPKVIGIVSKNTRIECVKIIEYVPVGYRNSLYVYATVLEGPFKSTLVEISDLSLFHSKSKKGVHLKRPNEQLLEKG